MLTPKSESERRHGLLKRPESPNALGALFPSTQQDEKATGAERSKTTEEETLQAAKRQRTAVER